MLERLATPMQVGEIYSILDELSPFSLQASWDNSGLNIGSMGQEVESIALALELDSTMAQHLKPNPAYHPSPAAFLPSKVPKHRHLPRQSHRHTFAKKLRPHRYAHKL